ncbi:hypothetical protein QYF36_001383 [Acer negundo]|nr:hypothetical protein QYF36_001383 [Acer negundo]
MLDSCGVWIFWAVSFLVEFGFLHVAYLFGIDSSLVTAIKPRANSSSIPAENLGLKVSRAVSYADIVKVPGFKLIVFRAVSGLEVVVVSPSIGINSVMVPNSSSCVLSRLDVSSLMGFVISSLSDAHDLGGTRNHVAHPDCFFNFIKTFLSFRGFCTEGC